VKGWNKWKDEYGKFQNGNGDNSSGFNALPGGFRDDDGTGIDVAIFWSATEIKTSKSLDTQPNQRHRLFRQDLDL
jgi:hypothetical protein